VCSGQELHSYQSPPMVTACLIDLSELGQFSSNGFVDATALFASHAGLFTLVLTGSSFRSAVTWLRASRSFVVRVDLAVVFGG
jgi:hypothetical protein